MFSFFFRELARQKTKSGKRSIIYEGTARFETKVNAPSLSSENLKYPKVYSVISINEKIVKRQKSVSEVLTFTNAFL